ncbi:hypothetical protein ACHAXR_003753 [Thalassiosira sp. AJA248-18]
MSGSGSYDAVDMHPRHQRGDDEQTTPSTPGLSVSQLSTPIMSQQKALSLILNTPPEITEYADNDTSLKNNFEYSHTEEAATAMPPLPSQQHTTPSIFSNHRYDTLEPPAWKPPEEDEIEYTDAWNNVYNTQHHYLKPGFPQAPGDDSTIGSSQTNNSFTNNNNLSMTAPNILRPRGLSLCSYPDAGSIGSCPHPPKQQQQHGQGQHHRRNPSLPVSFFSSGSQGSHQQLLFTTEEHQGYNKKQQEMINKQYLNSLQSTTGNAPYEIHSHHNASQVQADAAMAGLKGIMLDLYMVDRSVDSSSARMMATKDHLGLSSGASGNNLKDNDGISKEKKGNKKPRKTALGTLNDIQCILELHKVDKIVDRFKQGLQMPEFFEEEAWESTVWKDLRKTDVEMEEYAARKKSKEESSKETEKGGLPPPFPGKEQIQYHFDLSDDDGEGGWNQGTGLGGEDIYLSTESRLTDDYDAYQFFDPHETLGLQANSSYQTSQVSASINYDLNGIIDLLRTDAEVDGASKRQSEMGMIMPLFEIDQEMNKWKERSVVRDMWVGDLKDLYETDLEVDGAKKRKVVVPEPQKVEVKNEPAKSEDNATSIDIISVKQQAPVPPMESSTKPSTDQDVKEMLTQHIPQVSQKFCPTSPELVASKTTFHGSNASLQPLPPPVPMSSPQPVRRAIFSSQEKTANAAISIIEPKQAMPVKRSIFSRQEKNTAATQCAYQRGDMMPGTTTIVMKGGEMIDDIPVGKVVMR